MNFIAIFHGMSILITMCTMLLRTTAAAACALLAAFTAALFGLFEGRKRSIRIADNMPDN